MKLNLLYLFFLICVSHIYAETTVRIENGQIINTYFNCPDKLVYGKTSLLSDQHINFLTGVGQLGQTDNYEANHLFAQIYCIYLENSNLYIQRKNLCWDETNKTIAFQEGLSLPLINFMSRECGKPHDLEAFNLHTVNASKDPSLRLSHSEFILLKYLEEGIIPFANLVPKKPCQILSLGLVIYSSLDSCDQCQNHLLQTFSPTSHLLEKLAILAPESKNIPWFITYFSSQACKKSSYICSSESNLSPFYFDKAKKKFFSMQTNEEMAFPCSVEAFDLEQLTESLFFMSCIE